jgi:hypothetical protein
MKRIGAHLVTKSSVFYNAQEFIAAFTIIMHWNIPRFRWIQSTVCLSKMQFNTIHLSVPRLPKRCHRIYSKLLYKILHVPLTCLITHDLVSVLITRLVKSFTYQRSSHLSSFCNAFSPSLFLFARNISNKRNFSSEADRCLAVKLVAFYETSTFSTLALFLATS